MIGYNPLVLKAANASTEPLASLFSACNGNAAEYLKTTILPTYGVTNPKESEIAQLVALKGKGSFANALGKMLSSRGSINWSSGRHSASDVTLFGYGKGDGFKDLKVEMSGNWDNSELPLYIEKRLGLDLASTTAKLRAQAPGWVGKRDVTSHGEEHLHMEHN